MINNKLSLIALFFLADYFLCDDIFATLCGRILFKQPQNSDEFLYKEVINGIYIKTNKVVDNFPLYVNERGSIYFHYIYSLNRFYFSKPFPEEKYYLGLGAEADIIKMSDPKSWVIIADKRKSVFGGVVTKWFQYRINKNLYLKENLTIMCFNSTDCLFRDLILNYNNSYANDPLKDYFTPIDNLYSFNRQVYKHSNFLSTSWYLYYFDSSWLIGQSITSDLAYWAVFDDALKPEFITNVWKKYNGMKWEEQVGVTFQCRGLNKSCSDDRCTLNGVCSLNQLNRSTCTCLFNYTGDDCSKQSMTCKSDVEVANIEVGSIRANICLSTDSFYDVQCARTASGDYAWISKERCTIPTTIRATTVRAATTTTTTTATTATKAIPGEVFNIDRVYWLYYPGIIIVSCLPFLTPFIAMCIKRGSNQYRILSLWWYLSMVILLCYKSVIATFNLQIYGRIFFFMTDILIGLLVPTFYLYVLVEAQFCNEKKYLDSINNGDEIDNYLTLIYEKEPQVFIIIECYHFKTLTSIYTTYYGGTEDYSYQEKVTTYTDSKMFNFRTWQDVSDRSQVPSTRTKVTRIKLSRKLIFADNQTFSEFSNLETNFIEANKNRDSNFKSYIEFKISGFKDCIIDVDGKRPFWMNKVCFQLANFLALSWPYRWLFGMSTQDIEHSICKKISIIENLPPNISLATDLNYPNESIQSEQVELQPYHGVFSSHDHDSLCTSPTFLSESATIDSKPLPPYPYVETIL